MIDVAPSPIESAAPRRLDFFARWLSAWVVACMAVGIAFGKGLPSLTDALRRLELGTGILVTLFVNWLVKPFSMAFLGWLMKRLRVPHNVAAPGH